MLVTIIDGYVDEPSCLGVPPYIAPYPRYLAGAIKDSGNECSYLTIDDYRAKSKKLEKIAKSNLLVIIGGAIVPGKYLRSMPASSKEISAIAEQFENVKVLGGPIGRFGLTGGKFIEKIRDQFDFAAEKDLDACAYDFLTEGIFYDRYRKMEEWQRWSVKGAEVVKEHQDFPQPLIAELETYRGCVRYFVGGCSFCIEPLFGEPQFREPEDIINEVKVLNSLGITNFRLGAQSCFFSYKARGIGETETPTPNVEPIKKLLYGIRNVAKNLRVLHLDNANPAVIAEHEEEAREIAKLIVQYCTSGNVLAFGMESTDPEVIKENNLNATPEQVRAAIKLINEIGCERGPNGMPKLLPGLNILVGLKGETKQTFELNFQFLKQILDSNLLLRRINIRQVTPTRAKFDTKIRHDLFVKFKAKVRKEIDMEMLKRLLPYGTIMKDVFTEKTVGKTTYSRQIGTYPLLVGIPYKIKESVFVDVAIIDYGYRSVTGIQYPLNVNEAPIDALISVPRVGKKRAARIIRNRPFKSEAEFIKCFDEPDVAMSLLKFLTFN